MFGVRLVYSKAYTINERQGERRMSLTLEQRKERYYQFAKEKADKIYSLWEANKITSKKLVAKANEYAFDNRLKTNAEYRFYAYAFVLALELRLQTRYGTFLRRLFRFFAYIRERKALKTLKGVLGFDGDVDIREMLDVEVEKITVLLANRPNGKSTGGGKSLDMPEIALEEFDDFFEECIREDEPKTVGNDLRDEKETNAVTQDEAVVVNTEDLKREKISVNEFGKGEPIDEPKQENKSFSTTKQTDKTTEAEFFEKEKIEKPIEKTVANTSILAETLVLKQDRTEETPSPFPIFRENAESKPIHGKEESALSNENNDTKPAKQEGERLDKDISVETNQEKSPFPVFGKDKPLEIKTPEKVVEKEVKVTKEIDVVKGNSDLTVIMDTKISNEMTMHALSNISEENKTRGILNITMHEQEIQAIAEQIKMAAKMEMAMEEQAWREQISVAKTSNEMQAAPKENAPPANKGVVIGLKK